MLRPNKLHTRNLITKKNPAAQKFPSLPITFLMVLLLISLLHSRF